MDYHKLISDMEATGVPVSARIDKADTAIPHDGSCTPDTHQTIETTATPTLGWANVPMQVTFNPPQEESYAPTRRHIFQRLECRRNAALPNSITTKTEALLYEGLVNYAYLYQTSPERRDTIIRAVGGCDLGIEYWRHPQPVDNLVYWASKRMGTTSLLMALALGDVLGMKPEYIFSRFPNCPSNAPSKAILAKQPLAFPKQILTS